MKVSDNDYQPERAIASAILALFFGVPALAAIMFALYLALSLLIGALIDYFTAKHMVLALAWTH
jgi:ABC-type amino acid transport system permease subunit